ncbi:MAG: LLM class flavin-dependent oxidoreductase [Gordonia sp. (in: high G+C Gram-positive bacteria)]
MTKSRRYLGLALDGPQLLELTSDDALRDRWDGLPLAFTVLGSDRIDGSGPAATTLSVTSAAAHLAYRARHARVLIAASPHYDHPYNLARRVASLGHFTGGRSGLLLGVADAYAPAGERADRAWGNANLGPGASLTVTTAIAAGQAIRSLELGWPFETFIGDRETGILVQADQIVYSDIEGVYEIAGPLNLPGPPSGPSVIGVLSDDAVDHGLDLRIGADGDAVIIDVDDVDAGDADADADAGGADDEGVNSAGIILRHNAISLGALLNEVDGWLASGRVREITPGTDLRRALELAPVPARPSDLRPAFPAPAPHAAL